MYCIVFTQPLEYGVCSGVVLIDTGFKVIDLTAEENSATGKREGRRKREGRLL